jgi:hypothetical protein
MLQGVPRIGVGTVGGLLLVLLAAGSGCGGPAIGQVSGKVTFRGQPVTEGKVTFLPQGAGNPAEADLQSDGSYRVQTIDGGLVVGDYLVLINPPVVLVDTDPGKSPPSPMEKPVKNIPARYRNQGTPLKVTVQPGANTFDFDLTP